MCGIVGYTGSDCAQEILIKGLRCLEYRGYDSAGIAVQGDTSLEVIRCVGPVEALATKVSEVDKKSTCGIGHTRWATHGKPSIENAHPHAAGRGHIAVVHNGIIENYLELREALLERGHVFASETDSEVLSHLIEEAYTDDLLSAVREALTHVIGTYALAAMTDYEPGTLVVTSKDSPLVLGCGQSGSYVASDAVALIEVTRDVVLLKDYECAKLTPQGITYYNTEGISFSPEVVHLDWDIELTKREGYPDFMLKEIFEQPQVIRDTIAGRITQGRITIDELALSVEELNLVDRIYVIACGSSYHAGLYAKQLIEKWARIPTEVEVASEFRYRDPLITSTTLVIAISQSGETADTLAAVRDARIKGAKVFALTNVVGSPLAQESDGVIYTKARKEISVAATKSFLGQMVSLALLAMLLAQTKSMMSTREIRLLFRELGDTAEQIESILADTAAIEEAALACKQVSSALFIGRGFGVLTCYEGALKLKEISYLHAEAYPAGEMKHGPIALIEEGFPVVALATQSPTYDKMISNIQECNARGARVVAVASEGDTMIGSHADYVLFIPKVRDAFSPLTATVVLQLFARYVALARGCNIDKPRNLAKSVTVE